MDHTEDPDQNTATLLEQYHHFRMRSDAFRDHSMWNSSYIQRGASHYWHGQYTFKIYQELGFVAARVTSKLLGIGSCERAWGDTKHLRQGKRCSLSAEKLEMQSILFNIDQS